MFTKRMSHLWCNKNCLYSIFYPILRVFKAYFHDYWDNVTNFSDRPMTRLRSELQFFLLLSSSFTAFYCCVCISGVMKPQEFVQMHLQRLLGKFAWPLYAVIRRLKFTFSMKIQFVMEALIPIVPQTTKSVEIILFVQRDMLIICVLHVLPHSVWA